MPRKSQFILIERRGNSERAIQTANSLEEMYGKIGEKVGAGMAFTEDDLIPQLDEDGGFL